MKATNKLVAFVLGSITLKEITKLPRQAQDDIMACTQELGKLRRKCAEDQDFADSVCVDNDILRTALGKVRIVTMPDSLTKEELLAAHRYATNA